MKLHRAKNRLQYWFNLCCLYILMLWTNLSATVVHFDGRGRIEMATLLVCVLYNLACNKVWRRILLSQPVVIWLCWCIYASINAACHGFQLYETRLYVNVDQFIMQDIFRQVGVMAVTCYLYITDKKKTVRHLVVMLMVIGLIVVFTGERNIDSDTGRVASHLGNIGVLSVVVMVAVLAVAWVKRHVSRMVIIALVVFAAFIILMAQTRKAFGGMVIVLLFLYCTKVRITKPQTWLLLVVACLVFNLMADYIMSTGLGHRIESGSEDNITGISALDFLGDRALHYYLGWFLWLDYPLCGVGLANAPYYSGLPYVFHSEIITQLSENGIIGFAIYVYFYWIIGRNLIYQLLYRKRSYEICIVCVGGLVAVLFISVTAWTYAMPYYFALFGILAAEGKEKYSKVVLRSEKDNFCRWSVRRR